MRTDVHRPAGFNPDDYEWVGAYDNDRVYHGDAWLEELVLASKTTAYGTGRQCDHCGAHIRYVGVFRHGPTGDHLAVGETCADGRFEYDKPTFDALRKAAQLDRQKQRLLKASQEFRAAHTAPWDALDASQNSFVQDVLRKLRLYGSISDRQLEAVVKAVAQDAKKADEPEEVKVPAPSGRQTFTGEVVGLKWHEGGFGNVLKMTIKVTTDAGIWLCWVTVPSKLEVERGDTVTLTATLTVSDRDPSFAFGKRPSKAQVLEAA